MGKTRRKYILSDTNIKYKIFVFLKKFDIIYTEKLKIFIYSCVVQLVERKTVNLDAERNRVFESRHRSHMASDQTLAKVIESKSLNRKTGVEPITSSTNEV